MAYESFTALQAHKAYTPSGTSTPTSKFDWGNMLKVGGIALQQFGQTYPTGKELAISAQMGFASAKALRKQAEEVPKKAEWKITQERKYRKRLIGQQSFIFGYAGVEISLTALDILEETQREMLMDEEMIYREGQLSQVLLLEEAKYAKGAAEAQREAGEAQRKVGKKAAKMGGVGTGALAGFMVGGPVGAVIGGIAGGLLS